MAKKQRKKPANLGSWTKNGVQRHTIYILNDKEDQRKTSRSSEGQ